MADDSQIERRLSRLENDSNSIYDLISEVRSTQQEHSGRFDVVEQRLGAIDQRFDVVERHFGAIDQRFDVVERRFDAIDTTLTEVVRRLPEPS